MSICNPPPYVFQNGPGNIADATQVNANFNQVINDVNANAASIAQLNAFPQTNSMSFSTELRWSIASATAMYIIAGKTLLSNSTGTATVLRSAIGLTLNFATTGVNALDTGVIAQNSWYYMFIIDNGTTTAALASLSRYAPALPGGYTYYMYVGAVRTSQSVAQLISISGRGQRAQYNMGGVNMSSPVLAYTGTASPATSFAVQGVYVPPGAVSVEGWANITGTPGNWWVGPNVYYGGPAFANAAPTGGMGSSFGTSQMFDFMFESSSLSCFSTYANLNVYILGWRDAVTAV